MLYGETSSVELNSVEAGFILGLLISEGHFGGDGKQPHVSVKMHVRHERLLHWLLHRIPGSKLYGPYRHAERHYYQWMVRGEGLKTFLIPLLDSLPFAEIDPHAYGRYQLMKEKYNLSRKEPREADVHAGIILGLLLREGHFGGDGKHPHVTLRRQVRYEPLLRWLLEKVPGSRLYGPYNHGKRQYHQWVARGEILKNVLVPLLEAVPLAQLDPYALERYQHMKARYNL